MAPEPYTIFKATTNYNKTLLTNELEHNLKAFFQWGLLSIGGWTDVEIGATGYHGGSFSDLTPSTDPSYPAYSVYETPRKDLVYETDVDFQTTENPIIITGVRVNQAFYAPNDVNYAHYIDYPNGRVIFTNPLVSSDQVELSYSYRTVSVELADGSELWKELQYGTLRVENQHATDSDEGQWAAIPALKRQQLPAIIIECVPRGSNRPWQIGSQAMIVSRDVLFHIVAENRLTRNDLVDIVALEENKTFWLFNSDTVAQTTDWPLDYRGAKNPLGLTYPNLIEAHKWLKCRIARTVIAEVESRNPYLHEATVRATLEIIMTKD